MFLELTPAIAEVTKEKAVRGNKQAATTNFLQIMALLHQTNFNFVAAQSAVASDRLAHRQ